MKKIFLTSAICMIVAMPSYADIASGASSATCDSSTIGATEDSAGLEAQWNANTITINWYNGNTKVTTNTCSYDGAVTIPATPSKPGYIFNGWRVRTTPAGPNCTAITSYSTCYNTEGCVYNDSYGIETKCSVAISVNSTSYSTCAEIQDMNTCLSIVNGPEHTYGGQYTSKEPLCSWEGNSCASIYRGGTHAYAAPASFCEEADSKYWMPECYWNEEYGCDCND